MSSMQRRKPVFGFGINDADYLVAYRPDPQVRNKQIFCPFYKRWTGMLYRALGKKHYESVASYADTKVDESFKYFMDFRRWTESLGFTEQNANIIELDKDILIMGNNCYSIDTCAFVTKKINMLLLTSNKSRGDLLLGVHMCGKTGKYLAGQTMNGKRYSLGTFTSELEAHKAWQLSKADYIEKQVSNYEQESEEIGLVYRPDIVEALLKRSELLRNSAESGIAIDSL